MKTIKNSTLNLILACGIILLLAGFLTIVAYFNGMNSVTLKFWPLAFLILGFLCLYISFAFVRKPYLIFFGILFSLSACFSTLFVQEVIPFGIRQWWPVYGCLGGISLILSSMVTHRRLKARFLIPSVTLIILGLFFLLFSLDIIKVPLSKFFAVTGPVLMIIAGITIIILFLIQTNHKDLIVRDEENEVFED